MQPPKTSALVIADAPWAGKAAIKPPLQSLRRLVNGARLLDVPIFFVRYPRSAAPGLLATTWTEWVVSAETLFDPAMPKWCETELGAAIVASMRTHIICAGLWLEEAVTLLTLKALSIGMDPFVRLTETGTKKNVIIRKALAGDGRTKVEGWLPRYMKFPQLSYTARLISAQQPRHA